MGLGAVMTDEQIIEEAIAKCESTHDAIRYAINKVRQGSSSAVFLEDVELYRVQMAMIICAAFGYLYDDCQVHHYHDTHAFREVKRLRERYEQKITHISQLEEEIRQLRKALIES